MKEICHVPFDYDQRSSVQIGRETEGRLPEFSRLIMGGGGHMVQFVPGEENGYLIR